MARLAGVPGDLIERARAVLKDIEREADDLGGRVLDPARFAAFELPPGLQLGLFDNEPSELEKAVDEIDVEATTPMEALALLARLKDLR